MSTPEQRLLSDKDIAKAIVCGYIIPEDRWIAEAQCGHTERYERGKLAVWLSIDTCGHAHRLRMYQCHKRMKEAIEALREGKAPTESGGWDE